MYSGLYKRKVTVFRNIRNAKNKMCVRASVLFFWIRFPLFAVASWTTFLTKLDGLPTSPSLSNTSNWTWEKCCLDTVSSLYW